MLKFEFGGQRLLLKLEYHLLTTMESVKIFYFHFQYPTPLSNFPCGWESNISVKAVRPKNPRAKKCLMQGSNLRPSVCKTDAITTTPIKQTCIR